MEFSRQEYWSGLPFPSPGDLPNPGIQPRPLHCRQILYHLSHQESPIISEFPAYNVMFSSCCFQDSLWFSVLCYYVHNYETKCMCEYVYVCIFFGIHYALGFLGKFFFLTRFGTFQPLILKLFYGFFSFPLLWNFFLLPWWLRW